MEEIKGILENPLTVGYFSAILSLIIGLIVKDIAINFVSGLMFFLDKNFTEGDTVYIDGHKAVISKIGIKMTVFTMNNGRGLTWRFVPNSKIRDLELEKVVIPKETQLIPEMQRKITDMEDFLERAHAEFRKEVAERERKIEEKAREALEKGGSV
jgi:hypothetical protein